MIFDQALDPVKCQKFGERMTAFWSGQQRLDREALKIINLTQHFMAASDGKAAVESFESGIGHLVWRENAALLDLRPGLRVNVPEEDRDEKDFVDNVLEPWLAGARKRSQEGGWVEDRIGGDLASVGRHVSTMYPVPRIWVSEDYKQLVKKLQDEDDPDELERIKKEIRKFKQGRFPMRWRWVDPRSCWTTWGGEHRLPMTVEFRKLTYDEIEDEYGADAIPGDLKGSVGTTEIDVLEVANHFQQATIINSKEDPRFAKDPFEHGLEMSPYIFIEGPILAANDENWRWAGTVFHCADAIHQFDQVLTDWTVNHNEWTRAPVNVFLDPERNEKAAGRPPDIQYGPGKTNYFWLGEDVRKGVAETLNDQSPALLQELKQIIERTAFNPISRGEAKSGASDALFRTQVQVAERSRDPWVAAIERGYENWGVLALRGVSALNQVALDLAKGDKDFAASIDAVAVFSDLRGKAGVLELTPKQAKGWEPAIQARASRSLRMDETLATQTAKIKHEMGVSWEQLLEEDLYYEQPHRVRLRGYEELLKDGMVAQDTRAILALSGDDFANPSPEEIAELESLFPNASPTIRQIITDAQGAGSTGQSVGNMARAGQGEAPRPPQEAAI